MNKLTELDLKAKEARATHKDDFTPGRYYRKLLYSTQVTDITPETETVTWRRWWNCYPPESAAAL